jgi:hypothetical protein
MEGGSKMKRISVLAVVMLLVSPGLASFRGYGSLRYRTRYSPYAFSPSHKSGLVCGYVRYSPYAFGRHHSGLVYDNVRWSPYAFDEKHSGLIVDYCGYGLPYACYVPRAGYYRAHPRDRDDDRSAGVRWDDYGQRKLSKENDRLSRGEARMHELRAQQLARAKQDEYARPPAVDAERVISDYLECRDIAFRMNRVLKVGGKTASVDFLLVDNGTLIRYWDPEEAHSLAHQEGYKALVYEKYRQACSAFDEAYEARGGRVYEIDAADDEIVGKLQGCAELSGE